MWTWQRPSSPMGTTRPWPPMTTRSSTPSWSSFEKEGIGAERFEFQMLHGVRRDLQQELRKRGYNVRVYVPFGESWYPYLMRRLAERPANMLFFAGSVIQESPLGFLWPKAKKGAEGEQ